MPGSLTRIPKNIAITFATSSFAMTPKAISSLPGFGNDAPIETTPLNPTDPTSGEMNERTFITNPTKRASPFTIRFYYDPDKADTIPEVNETMTITHRTEPGDSTGTAISGDVAWGTTGDVIIEDGLLVFDQQFVPSGTWTRTAAT